MSKDISNSDDVIDSRDVIARIEELEDELRDEDGNIPTPEDWKIGDEHLSEIGELIALKALADDAESYGDWDHGAALINEDYFVKYAQQLAEGIGATSHEITWPHNHIDWNAAADELKSDYTEVKFDGTTYLIRS